MLAVNVSELIFCVIFSSSGYAEEAPARNQPGAATRSRTLDLLITSELLYRLSYGGSRKRYAQLRVANDRR